MYYFGSPEKTRRVMRRGVCHKHHFCAICGKELTKLNLKRGFMSQERHILVTLENGFQFRRCWNSTVCEKRRKEKECRH